MAKINGTSLLVYSNGTLIASQTSCTVSWEQDLPGTTTKDSSGWEEHINGTRRATCDFDALFSTTGLSDSALMAYITGRSSVILVIDGGGFPIVGEANLKSLSINAPKEEAAGLSGSFTFQGPAWMLTGSYVNLMTDPDANGTDYDIFTVSGIAVTRIYNAAGSAYAQSNTYYSTSGEQYKVITYLTFNSGSQSPTIKLWATSERSNIATLSAGINIITLTSNYTGNVNLRIDNTDAADFSLTNIYWFKI